MRLHRPNTPSSQFSDTSPQLSQSLPADSTLFKYAGSLKGSVKQLMSPKSQRKKLQTVVNPVDTITSPKYDEDLSSSPLSFLMPSLERFDAANGSDRSWPAPQSGPPSETSDSTTNELSLSVGNVAELSKHRSRKVESTRKLVKGILERALEGVHGTLKLVDGVLPFGLDGITKLLLNILDKVEQIKCNQEECLSLIRRCTTIMKALFDDIERELSPAARETIRIPCERLHDAFTKIGEVVSKIQKYNAFERLRYSGEILGEIDGCHQALDDCLRDFSTSILLRILDEIRDIRISPHQPLIGLPTLHGNIGLPSVTLNASGCLSPHLNTSDIQGMSTELLCDAIRRLEDEQKRRDRERDIQSLKYQAKKMSRHRSWPLVGAEGSRHSRLRAGSYFKDEVPFLDVLLIQVVGRGPVSRVYKAVLDQEIVAVKIYAAVDTFAKDSRSAVKDIVANEIEIWKQLNHPNVLGFRSRGTTTGAIENLKIEFAISPFIHHGNVASYLQQMRWNHSGVSGGPKHLHERMIFLDTAKGMEYLHSEKILHGNLKASNVLIDQHLNCLISDFKYSKRLGGSQIDEEDVHCGIRWQGPEVMKGKSTLRESVDIYAYAIFCTEILNLGEIPWPYFSDDDIRHGVLGENWRPSFPRIRAEALGITPVIETCWDSSPDLRPRFKKIVKILKSAYNVD